MNDNSHTNSAEQNKTKLGLLSIAFSVLAVLLGFVIRKPFVDVISVGFIFSFAGMILSLAAVRNTGRNTVAQLAFWLGFVSMWITVYLGASA
ncbi:MAG: hypothetical protein IJI10_10635 [Eubacterium sp.]|nr:hypothetical protein [Eubacterium sp.]